MLYAFVSMAFLLKAASQPLATKLVCTVPITGSCADTTPAAKTAARHTMKTVFPIVPVTLFIQNLLKNKTCYPSRDGILMDVTNICCGYGAIVDELWRIC
jgi:hypothetical protein